MPVSLVLTDATCLRGGRALFERLSIALDGGDLLAVGGPNGAGKTSLLRLIAGLLPPAAGSIRLIVDGEDINDAESRGKYIGWLGSADAVEPQTDVRVQLAYFARIHRVPAARADEMLERCGLWRQRDLPGAKLSAGQRRRLALARLMTAARPLWLMDEAMSLLDETGRALVREALGAHCAAGGIAVTAGQDELALPCRRLALPLARSGGTA